MGARETALNALMACRKEGAWSNGVLKQYVQRDNLDRREAALASRLCYGVLQNRAKLDHYLAQLLQGSIKKLHPVVHDILQLGLYQIYEMDKIPQSAAVNEGVSLAKRYCKSQSNAPGLVNAVLRRAAQTKGTLREPQELSVKYSHPEKLLSLLRSYVGPERLEAMLQANNAAPETVAQVNTLKITASQLEALLKEQGVDCKPHRWMKDCLVLGGTGNLEQLKAFQEGLFYIQDPAAKLSVLCAGLPKGERLRVLDCCAAPGGKSFAAAITLGGCGEIHSCDIHAHKTGLIEKGARRLGITNLTAHLQDGAQRNAAWISSMDAVIADVPCSGYGIIRKKPDIRYKDPDTMNELPGLQLRILLNQADYVKPGGVLMYSTCTLVRKENEGVVEKFLRQRPDFCLEPLPLPEPFPENSTGMLALVPGEYDTDGFFICRMRRKA